MSKVLVCACIALVGTALAAPAPQEFKVTEIAPGNFVHFGRMEERSHANLGDNANIGFIIGSHCVLVIDTGGSIHIGKALRLAIREKTPLPVCYVVQTHVHPDHFFGAAAFREDQPEFIGHANLPGRCHNARGPTPIHSSAIWVKIWPPAARSFCRRVPLRTCSNWIWVSAK